MLDSFICDNHTTFTILTPHLLVCSFHSTLNIIRFDRTYIDCIKCTTSSFCNTNNSLCKTVSGLHQTSTKTKPGMISKSLDLFNLCHQYLRAILSLLSLSICIGIQDFDLLFVLTNQHVSTSNTGICRVFSRARHGLTEVLHTLLHSLCEG